MKPTGLFTNRGHELQIGFLAGHAPYSIRHEILRQLGDVLQKFYS
jgi:hypothetical protein